MLEGLGLGIFDRDGQEIHCGDTLVTFNSNKKFSRWSEKDYGETIIFYSPTTLSFIGTNWTPEVLEKDSVYNVAFVKIKNSCRTLSSLMKKHSTGYAHKEGSSIFHLYSSGYNTFCDKALTEKYTVYNTDELPDDLKLLSICGCCMKKLKEM